MKKLKKILTSMLAFMLIFVGAISLGGCGSNKTGSAGVTFSYVTCERVLSSSYWNSYFEININNPTNEDVVIYQNNFNVEACYEFKENNISHNYSIDSIYTTYTEKTTLADSYGNKIDKSLQINNKTQQTIYLYLRISESRAIYSDTTTYYHLKSITISYFGDIIIQDLPMGD